MFSWKRQRKEEEPARQPKLAAAAAYTPLACSPAGVTSLPSSAPSSARSSDDDVGTPKAGMLAPGVDESGSGGSRGGAAGLSGRSIELAELAPPRLGLQRACSVRQKAAYFEALIRCNHTTTHVQCDEAGARCTSLLDPSAGAAPGGSLARLPAPLPPAGVVGSSDVQMLRADSCGLEASASFSDEAGAWAEEEGGFSEVQLVLRVPRGAAAPPVGGKYGSVADMEALIEKLQAALDLKERQRKAAADAYARRAAEVSNLQQVVRELSESRAKAVGGRASLVERYQELQREYHRCVRVADLSRTVSKENMANTSRTRTELRRVQLELHATKRDAQHLSEKHLKARVENALLKEKVTLLERLDFEEVQESAGDAAAARRVSASFMRAAVALYALLLLGALVLYSGLGQHHAVGEAAQLWPASGLGPSARPQDPRVEYRDAGNIVSLAAALDAAQWEGELQLYSADAAPSGTSPAQQAQQQAAPASGASGSGSAGGEQQQQQENRAPPPYFPVQCPQGEAQAKRAAIRRTWLQHARDHLPGVTVRFILAQPATEAEHRVALALLGEEIQQHADIVIVPGLDTYRNLPSKTLQLLKFALSSDCQFTHVMKTDDDVYVRPQMLMDVIQTGHYNFSVEVQSDGQGVFDGRPATFYQSPWMNSMYVGQLDSEKPGHLYPGWDPNRDKTSKWYLSYKDLPDSHAPLGVRWCSGWGYLLSRDLAEFISNTAHMYAAIPAKKPLWWGRMPWEDIMIAAMLKGVARVHHHDGFRSAWQGCGSGTVLKHLDNDAPLLQEGLYVQELSGLWAKKEVVCSTGPFEPGNHSDWRLWRNSLPDNQIGGFMR
ncbi:putative beta-1,3-galactosyltransferase 16 isoform X1 isoform B [Micractinium conductrix]|uniref:Putative beta-1,3-galactosyltransferase 16 isoform X1 isoform A n=1 Tax=Micractinium conductrix TaxID=554055 RepID=A0A2P6VID3_9CHLO|nr:putative beta-1,3-galactosyltransferase 16 isoform X1 isoform A [Micractinium conductrix]PSC73856.1 putative beta-1,3-galactosyltransferase 16 isoform X1 isoform B [Micractinium conductrix]|eukprot:PSC73855.1 putative beta-1,3-galactosyltransferase 16 isoform X1 isoform A [Micractinium conductrix]